MGKGRKLGNFNNNKQKLYQYLLTTNTTDILSDNHLAKETKTTIHSIRKYLEALKKENKIKTTTKKLKLGDGWYNRRFIEVIQ